MKYLLSVILILLLSIPSLLKAGQKSIDRIHDPVVLECKDFDPLFGTPVKKLSLMAKHNDKWIAVPFQVDQKKPDGAYAFSRGPEASADPDPDLDANDELAFMVMDTGDQAAGDTMHWPPGVQAAVEVEVSDPKNNTKGWVYLMSFSADPPRSDKDYIEAKIDEANNYRSFVSYEYKMGGPADHIYPDMMAVRTLPNGDAGKDVVERFKITGKITLLGGISFEVDFGEMTKAEMKGVIDGPVRVLVLADAYIEFAGFFKVRTQGFQLISYYANHAIWPMSMDVPVSDLGLIRNITIYGYIDLNDNVYGSQFLNEANPYNTDVVLDGSMSAAEKNLDRESEISWAAGFGPQGALIVRLFMKPKLPGLKQITYYIDDKIAENPYSDEPGMSAAGYELQGFKIDPDRPTAISYTYYYQLSSLNPEQVTRILDILDNPLKVATTGPVPVDSLNNQ